MPEGFLSAIADALPALIAYVDHDERYHYVNLAYETWYGTPRSAALGHTLREFLGDGRYARIRPHVKRALAGEPVTFEATVDHRDGTRRFVRAVYVPDVAPGGAVKGYVSQVSDLTDVVRASRTKDQFLATISHELRTPLNAVLGWARMLREGAVELAEHAHALEVIERNARAQVQLIEDLLDVSRIVSGTVRFEMRRIRLQALIENVRVSVKPLADAKKIDIKTALDRGIGPIVGDAERLTQVISNLLINAIKFTRRKGTIEVRLSAEADAVRLTVTDTGEGIAPEVLPAVFDLFRQGESGTTRRFGGLGIGLALVKHVVEAHAGTVTVESAGHGTGATFTVILPHDRRDDRA